MAEIDGFDSLASKINQIKKASVEIEKLWDKINKHAKGIKGGVSGNGSGKGSSALGLADVSAGSGAVGMPTQSNLGGSSGGGKFVSSFGGAALSIGGKFNSAVEKYGLAEFRDMNAMFGAGDLLSYMGQLGGAVNTFLPDVTQTMNRATGYYNAGIYGGNAMSRRSLQSATFGTLGRMNAVTSEGSDARVAQYLASRGMTASGGANSTYQQTLRTIGNAGLYMNISNEEAAASIEGLTSARGASNMLRNFGIYTADISTGKEKTQGQIFEELAQRLTAGRGNATVEQTQASIRRGALGVTVDAFFQGDQQGAQMFKQYMIERAGGRKMDFASSGMAGTPGNLNPLRSQMALSTSNTAAQQAAEESYITGIEAATNALQILNVAAAGAAKSFLGIASSFGQLLFGANTTKGVIQGVTSTVNFASKGVNALMQDARSGDAISGAYHLGVMTLGAAGLAGVAGGTLFGTLANSGSDMAPQIGTGGAATGALISSQMGIGASAGPSPVGGAPGVGPDAGASGSLFDISVVARGHSVTGKFGSVSSIRGGRPHRGTDYSHNNDPVYAIGDGEVIFTRSTYNHNDATGNSFGNYVAIVHTSSKGDKYTSLYGHLSKVLVKVGDKVRRGQKIGISGNTGHSTGPHLHLEIVKGRTTTPGVGTAISPSDAAKIAGSTTLSDGSMTTGTDGGTSALAQQATALSSSVQNQQKAQVSMLMDLYSGDKSRMTSAVSGLAKNLGIGDLFSKNYTGTYISGESVVDMTTGGGNTQTGGNTNNNNVTIVVQVPDVTSADAIKFASLVKQYLDSNTLMSNTGSI